VKLVQNFRSHKAILNFPNDRFYNGDLQECGDRKTIDAYLSWTKHPRPHRRFPIIFHAMHGKDDREASSPSFFNIDEVLQVRQYVRDLRDDRRIRISKFICPGMC
jgi:helicase MOV-10